MTATLVIAALAVAFPREGAKLPFVEKCYFTGSVSPGVTNVTVQGKPAGVHPLGGWVAMADLVSGSNAVEVVSVDSCRGETQRTVRVLYVARKPPLTSKVKAAVRKFEKVPCASDTPKPHPSSRPEGPFIAVIDPGHGGDDTGALSPHSLPEKDVNLRLSRAVAKELEKRGWKAVMTREGDEALPLFSRPERAHRENADVFVSIHHNAPPYDRNPLHLRYHCVYAWNDLGSRVAEAINSRMAKALEGEVKNNGVLRANYAVTRNPEIPSCLVEADFITHPEGEIDSWNRARISRLASAIADGLEDWRKTP